MKTAVLLMAYGSPTTSDDIEAYFTDIRQGGTPSGEALWDLIQRYHAIGGPSRLNEVTRAQAAALKERLQEDAPDQFDVYIGMKHWHPFIREAVDDIVEAGLTRVIGLVMAPHYSKQSIGEYQRKIEDTGASLELHMISSWYHEPRFIRLVARNIKAATKNWADHRVFFTAHSVPKRIIDEGDPYSDQLHESAQLIADATNITDWEVAWQSASHTGEQWIGPDILERLDALSGEGGKRALIAPIGFVADHLEILYDIDIECAERAGQLGLDFRRIRSPNDHPRFIRALAKVVLRSSPPT